MVAPSVQISSDPTLVRFSWTELTSATNGGLTTLSYKLEILTPSEEYV